MSTVDLTPSPRILRMLGRIDFDLWRCIAELIDNSLDAFIDAERKDQPVAVPRIEIFLPKNSDNLAGAIIQINDNGPGMTIEILEQSLKAGLSNNDPFSNFGLFGMGFNIATARMGSHTEVWTTRTGDEYWTRVTIDFEQLERQRSFTAPFDFVEKDDIDESGTKIIVSQINSTQLRELSDRSFQAALHKRLGRVYSRVLTSTRGLSQTAQPILISPVRIFINGKPVTSRPHCIWGENRFQMKSSTEKVNAVLPIDIPLDPQRCCRKCWSWLSAAETICPACNSGDNIELRPRQIRGWIGLQRFGDKNDYGIDFIRNGRKIMTFDRSLFAWEDPITGNRLLEYPIDMNMSLGGRIVGEIELDHVTVTYQKDSFEKNDTGWREAITYIRGDGPLGPKISERYGYPINTSPFARFYSAFRRADPGLHDLYVKDNVKAREWAELFWASDPEYQTDNKWYREAERFEIEARQSKGRASANDQAGDTSVGDSFDELLGNLESTSLPGVSPPSNRQSVDSITAHPMSLMPAVPPKTERQQLEEQSEVDADFSRSYVLDSRAFPGTQPLDVRVMRLLSGKRMGTSQQDRLILKRFPDPYQATIVYDAAHPFFERFEDSISDLLLLEIASLIISRSSSRLIDLPGVAQAYIHLKDKYDTERRIDVNSLANEASSLLFDLKDRSVELLREDFPRAFELISAGEQEVIYRRWLEESPGTIPPRSTLINNGEFLLLTPWSAFPRIVQAWPQPFLDGGFWEYPYEDIDTGNAESDAILRQQRLERIVNLLHDVVWLMDGMSSGSLSTAKYKPHLIRCAQSLRLLRSFKVRFI